MRRLDWKAFVVLGIIVSVVIGFLYGTGILGGDAADPGSSADPLISQSYADTRLDRIVQDLEAKITVLESKVSTLENELTVLSGGTIDLSTSRSAGSTGSSGSSSSASTSGSGSSSSSGSGSTGAASVSQANVGKSASVSGDVVNLRDSASTSSAIKKKLSPSDTFTITKVDTDNGWYQVQLSDGTIGWVAGYLVKIK